MILDRRPTDREAGLRIAIGEHVPRALGVQRATFPFHLPLLQQHRRGGPAVDKRERRIACRGRCSLSQRQIAQPHACAVIEDHFGVGPVRLIAGDAVTGVANFQEELACPAQIYGDGDRLHPFVQGLGAEPLLAGHAHGEDDAAAAAGRLVIGIDADDGRKRLARSRQADDQLAHSVTIKPARIGRLAERQGPAFAAGVPENRIVIGQHDQPRFVARAGSGRLNLGGKPAMGLGDFLWRRKRRGKGAQPDDEKSTERHCSFQDLMEVAHGGRSFGGVAFQRNEVLLGGPTELVSVGE